MEGCTLGTIRFRPDAPAHQRADVLGNGEAETGAAPGSMTPARIARGVLLEHPFQLIGLEADTGIGHGQAQRVLHDPHLDLHPTGGGELQAVGDEIVQHLPQACRIAEARRVGCVGDDQLEQQPAGGGQGAERRHGLLRDPARVEGDGLEGQVARLDPGKVQHIVQQLDHGLSRRQDNGQPLPLCGTQVVGGHDLGHGQDTVQGRTEFVADGGQEF